MKKDFEEDYQNTGVEELGDIAFEQGDFGRARCQYEGALRKEMRKRSKRKPTIEMLERKIDECGRKERHEDE